MPEPENFDLAQAVQSVKPLLDAAHNGIMVIDRVGRILAYNQAAMNIFMDQEPAVGRHFLDLRPDTWPALKEILETGTPQLGVRLDIEHSTIIANRNPIRWNGEIIGVVSVFQDISEFEAIVSQLSGYQRLAMELDAVFKNSQDGIYLTDGNAKTLRVNSAYEKITGLKRSDLVGRYMNELVEQGALDHSVTLEVIKNKTQVSIIQKIRGGKSVLVTGSPVFDTKGDIELVVSNVRDITALTKLRDELNETRLLTMRYHQSLREQDQYEHALQEIVAQSKQMGEVVKKAIKVAEFDSQVLISGESGVGKSMLARVIHNVSPRKDRPFIKINCGTIPEHLMESELFGYERGAFTGANTQGKAGLIETAHGGTVFFDEIGELPLGMQVKLLQVIDEKTFTRIGGNREVAVDVKIIAATNRNLERMAEVGEFRQDLFYRLSVVPIDIPPLRERKEDIPALAHKILNKFRESRGVNKRLHLEALDRLMNYAFPGNIRELFNIMERMVVMSDGDILMVGDLPTSVQHQAESVSVSEGVTLKEAVAKFEAGVIAQTLQRYGTVEQTARVLDIHPTTLWRKAARGKKPT